MKRFGFAVLALLLGLTVARAEFVTTKNSVHPNGTRAQIDLPADQHMQNIGSRVDGAGMCVTSSIEVGARWHVIPEMQGLRDYCAGWPGGSTPSQVAEELPRFATKKGITLPKHVQHTGGDVEFLKRALKTRRMVSMTYGGHDPFYGDKGIAHMVNGAHLDGGLGAIIDNNQAGQWRWMSDTQLINRWIGKRDNGGDIVVFDRRGRAWPVGGGWCVVWLKSPPPPVDVTSPQYLPDLSEPGTWDAPDELPDQPDPEQWSNALTNREVGNILDLANGVKVENLKPKMRYYVDGVEVTRREAFGALDAAGDLLADDSGKAFLSVVSDTPVSLAALAPYADKLHVGVFPTDSWVAKTRLKFKLTAQLPGSKTVFTSATVTDADLVKAAKAALGIVDPPPPPPEPVKPGPKKPDDEPKKPPADPQPTPVKIPQWVLLAVGAFLIYLFSRRSA